MSQTVQQIVDILIIVMGGILVLFMIALLIVHLITNTDERHMRRMKEQLLRFLSAFVRIEYMRGLVFSFLDPAGEIVSLRQIRGLRTRRGVQVLEMVAREITGEWADVLREAVQDGWYRKYMDAKLASADRDTATLLTKFIAELSVPGYTDAIVRNLMRYSHNADAQQIGILALCATAQEDALVRLLSDDAFTLILSFRTMQELFHTYSGDDSALYRRLLDSAKDLYVKRACIHGIAVDGCRELCGRILPELDSPHINIVMETVRTMGKLQYTPAVPAIYRHLDSDSWELRSAAIDALVTLDPEHCYEKLSRCLLDKVWWVRFHAAEALMQLPVRERLLADVRSSGDRYAYEMIRYMLERDSLLNGEEAV